MAEEIGKKLIYLGCDHAALDEKNELQEFLNGQGYKVIDLGCFEPVSCDYPDIAREVSEKIIEIEGSQGILICGTGIGMSMAANKLKGIRAALCKDEADAEMTRKHNDANVLCMGGRTMKIELLKKVAVKFLTTEFEGDRHARRVDKIHALEDGNETKKEVKKSSGGMNSGGGCCGRAF